MSVSSDHSLIQIWALMRKRLLLKRVAIRYLSILHVDTIALQSQSFQIIEVRSQHLVSFHIDILIHLHVLIIIALGLIRLTILGQFTEIEINWLRTLGIL